MNQGLRLLNINLVLPAPDQRPEMPAGDFHPLEPIHAGDTEPIMALGAAPHPVALKLLNVGLSATVRANQLIAKNLFLQNLPDLPFTRDLR